MIQDTGNISLQNRNLHTNETLKKKKFKTTGSHFVHDVEAWVTGEKRKIKFRYKYQFLYNNIQPDFSYALPAALDPVHFGKNH